MFVSRVAIIVCPYSFLTNMGSVYGIDCFLLDIPEGRAENKSRHYPCCVIIEMSSCFLHLLVSTAEPH